MLLQLLFHRMFGKRSKVFGIFSLCCTTTDKQFEFQTEIEDPCSSKLKKDSKISLKQSSPRINHQNLQLLRPVNRKLIENDRFSYPIPKQRSLFYYPQSSAQPQKLRENIPLKQNVIKTAFKHPCPTFQYTSNFKDISNSPPASFELSKTTKFSSARTGATNMSKISFEYDMKETKQVAHPKKQLFHLNSFKDSVVSGAESSNALHKLQESLILIDFFNPPTEKVVEVQGYLKQRQ